jgi:23S rRNA (pseudouridine1915-N3)-methyltransferase
MTQIEIIAAARMKNSPFADLWQDYHKRMTDWKVTLIEIEGKNQAEEIKKIQEKIRDDAYVIALDERGKSMSSPDFAAKMEDLMGQGRNAVQFVIGGADGLGDDLRKRADTLMSFGVQTWPHMMVRVMLIEQIYRARQINAGHPYHRV